MLTLPRPKTAPNPAILGRLHGLLLLLLGASVLALLLHSTEGHRARLAAEGLGVLLGGAAATVVSGISRPSPQVVTRAYVRLNRHMRRCLLAGMTILFGFAAVTAIARRMAPGLREVPALGGLVTFDWVLSLTMLAVAGAALLLIGLLALVARPVTAALPAPDGGRILERLWSASNSDRGEELRACFTDDPAGDALYRQWRALSGPAGGTHVILVRSTTIWGRSLSEWCARSEGDMATQRWILIAREYAGRVATGEFFRPMPVGEMVGSATSLARGGL